MKNICLIFFIIFLPWAPLSAQEICNQSQSSWTLLFTDGEIVKIGADTCIEFETDLNTLVCYALEIKADKIYSHGFMRLQAMHNDFIIQDAEAVAIYLQNLHQEAILVEYYRYSFLLQPGESRELKDLAVSHDYVAQIQFSKLGEGTELIPLENTKWQLQWLGDSLWLNF
ncbi:MAG: hypothetical protein RBT30_03600 [Patescibacteria group bacterium]|jgi:hypothetical protein|nr:hypothetical protein [Patescibacteria group bacterium]